jgi:hypothetical protein
MPIFLLEVDRRVAGVVQTLRVATKTKSTFPSDTPASVVYREDLVDAGRMSRSISLGAKLDVTTNAVTFELDNVDGRYDGLLNDGLDDAEFRLKEIANINAPVSGATLVARGVLRGINGTNALASVKLDGQDMLGALGNPLLTARYAGTTIDGDIATPLAEGIADMAGTLKPGILGSATNVEPKLVNAFRLFYQVSIFACTSITVKDGGAALTNIGNFVSLTALRDAALAAGQYATCLSLGIFRLGTAPAFVVTADVVEGATASLRSASRVAQHILSLYGTAAGDINTSAFDALHALYPAEVELNIDGEDSALDLIQRVLASNHAVLFPSNLGVYAPLAIAAPSVTAADTYTLRDIGGEAASFSILSDLGGGGQGEGVPAWQVNVNYGPVWRAMAAGDLVGSTTLVSLATRDFLSKSIRPATPAQDLTVKTAHPKALALTIDTLLKSKADADALATRLLALYKVRRDRNAAPIAGTRGRRNLGDTVAMQIVGRFGYDAGKHFLVVGRSDDFSKYVTTPELWG